MSECNSSAVPLKWQKSDVMHYALTRNELNSTVGMCVRATRLMLTPISRIANDNNELCAIECDFI